MVQGYTRQLKALLRKHGCEFVRAGKRDHEVWRSPHADKPVVIDGKMVTAHRQRYHQEGRYQGEALSSVGWAGAICDLHLVEPTIASAEEWVENHTG